MSGISAWIQKLMQCLFMAPRDETAPLKQEIAYLKKQLSESRLKDKGIDTTFIFDPASIKTINSVDLYKILNSAFRRVQIKLADEQYQYTSLAEVQRWSSFDPTNELQYRKEITDCDKFALTDMAGFKSENNYQLGNAVFGMAWGYANGIYHAWNICLAEHDQKIGLYHLEPQSDLIFSVHDKSTNNYEPNFIYI